MKTEAIERALRVVQKEMGCQDAYLRFGGELPDDPRMVTAPTPGGFVLVAVFENPPEARDSAARRLRQLGDSFFASGMSLPTPPPDAEQQLALRRLDDELSALAGRSGAAGATVIDMKSPVIWGCSGNRNSEEDLDTFLATAELDALAREHGVDLAMTAGLVETDRSTALSDFDGEVRGRLLRLVERLSTSSLHSRRGYLLQASALRDVRRWAETAGPRETSIRRLVHTHGLSYFARSFAGIYLLVLFFPEHFSELHVEGAALHSLPVIERHVLGLPPVDPSPPGGKVLKMPFKRP